MNLTTELTIASARALAVLGQDIDEAARQAAEAAEEAAEEVSKASRAARSSVDENARRFAPDFAAVKATEASSHLLRAEVAARKALKAAETTLATVREAQSVWAKAPR